MEEERNKEREGGLMSCRSLSPDSYHSLKRLIEGGKQRREGFSVEWPTRLVSSSTACGSYVSQTMTSDLFQSFFYPAV